ncbi:MAG: helix-turn-helix domain-containing protein [Candidatus Eremiobacteraeota bacterium]|nr:helix-turn-helix domain-containing protein [Candidatus Eremiobacteraeota bacterium]
MNMWDFDRYKDIFTQIYGHAALMKLEDEREAKQHQLMNVMGDEEKVIFRKKYIEIMEEYNQKVEIWDTFSEAESEAEHDRIHDKLKLDEELLGWNFVEYVRGEYPQITKSLPDEYLFSTCHLITRVAEQDIKMVRRAYGYEPLRKKPPEKLFTTEEAAKVLRLQVPTLRKYIREGKVNAIKIGQHWKIKQREITKIKRSGIK